MGEIYSVSRINSYISNMFAHDYLLKNIQIKGELSNVKLHSSGHIYFTLKDEGSAIAGVMFRSNRVHGLDFTPENGQSVIVSGNVSVYERDGRYQVYAAVMQLDGRGNLYEEYERLKQKLFEEGLFDFEHKKDIPKFPKKVGIVTASTGAAIRDIVNIAKRRNPYVQLYLYPAKVQGDGAAATIVKGIQVLDAMDMDTIIVGRGGGSIEDLWPFNEEIVARAIYEAKTPIISGTGHEIDNTIADYAADLRAPTPSAACELAIPDIMERIAQLNNYEDMLKRCMRGRLNNAVNRADIIETKLLAVSPVTKLHNQRVYVDKLHDRLVSGMESLFQNRMHRYEVLLTRLDGLSPTAKLCGGYGYVEVLDKPMVSVKQVKAGDNIRITIHDGQIEGKAEYVKEE